MCVFVYLSLYLSLCFLMIKWAQTAAGEPTPTRGSCGEVPDLAEEGAGGLIKSLGNNNNNKKKNLSCTKGLLRVRRSSHLKRRPVFFVCCNSTQLRLKLYFFFLFFQCQKFNRNTKKKKPKKQHTGLSLMPHFSF